MQIAAALIQGQRDVCFLKGSCIISRLILNTNVPKMCNSAYTGTPVFFLHSVPLILMKKPSHIISLTIMTCNELPPRQRATRSTVFTIINFCRYQSAQIENSCFH